MTLTMKKYWGTSLFPACFLIAFAAFLSVARGQDDDTVLYIDEDESTTVLNTTVAPSYQTYADQEISPEDAYRQLVAGNARYLKQGSSNANALPRSRAVDSKFPIATIVYSPDMPIQPTVLTQTTSRDVYLTTAEAGAVSAEDLTEIEYGLVNLQTPLLVVMGHYPSRVVLDMIRDYDAIKRRATAEAQKVAQTGTKLPNYASNVADQYKRYNLIGPAIARAKEAYPDLAGNELANVVSEALVWQSLETILMRSTTAQDLVRAERLKVCAAIVDDQTRKIYWLGEHPLQEEFLKPTPDELRKTDIPTAVLTESDLPPALDDTAIQEYLEIYENDPYYNQIVYDYYTDPVYYQPSWELFSSRAWVYRPWYGVWVDPFVPWPYWQPWYPINPVVGAGVGVSYWDGRLNFFIGYNRYYGVPIYYDPHFRPYDPYWRDDYYVYWNRRVHDPLYDLIIAGRRADIVYGPPRPHRGPGPHYHPGGARPGIAVTLGGIRIAVGGSNSPRRPGGPAGPGGPGGPIRPDRPRGPIGPDNPNRNRPIDPVAPNRRPGGGSITPNRDPGRITPPNRNPGGSETPNRNPGRITPPNRNPGGSVTPNRDPGRITPSNRNPGGSVTPNRDPSRITPPNRNPGGSVTPNRDPGRVTPPNRIPGGSVTPNRDPGRVTPPNRIPGASTTPNRDPGRVALPNRNSGVSVNSNRPNLPNRNADVARANDAVRQAIIRSQTSSSVANPVRPTPSINRGSLPNRSDATRAPRPEVNRTPRMETPRLTPNISRGEGPRPQMNGGGPRMGGGPQMGGGGPRMGGGPQSGGGRPGGGPRH